MKFYHFVAVAIVVFAPAEARADRSAAICQVHSLGDLKPPLAANIRGGEGGAARICKFPNGKVESIFILTVPRREGRVCFFHQITTRTDGRRIGGRPYSTMMAISDAARCPSQRERDYIFADGVSPGLFLEINRFWNGLSDSSKLRVATASLSDFEMHYAGRLRDMFKSKVRPRLSSVGLRLGDENVRSGYTLGAPTSPTSTLSLTIEWTKSGFVVVSMSEVIV